MYWSMGKIKNVNLLCVKSILLKHKDTGEIIPCLCFVPEKEYNTVRFCFDGGHKYPISLGVYIYTPCYGLGVYRETLTNWEERNYRYKFFRIIPDLKGEEFSIAVKVAEDWARFYNRK